MVPTWTSARISGKFVGGRSGGRGPQLGTLSYMPTRVQVTYHE